MIKKKRGERQTVLVEASMDQGDLSLLWEGKDKTYVSVYVTVTTTVAVLVAPLTSSIVYVKDPVPPTVFV